MPPINRLSSAAIAVALALTATAASADMLTLEAQPFSLKATGEQSSENGLLASSTTPGNTSVSIPQFDPVLGTLRDVMVRVDGAFVVTAVVAAFGEPVSYASSASADLNLVVAGQQGQRLSEQASAACDIAGTLPICTDTETSSRALPGSVDEEDGPDTFDAVDDFIGTGSFDIALDLVATAEIEGFLSTASVVTATADATASGSITVTYDFEPAVVEPPMELADPNALGLLGGALLLLSASRRRG